MGSNDQIKCHIYYKRIFFIFCLPLCFSIIFFNIALAETEILHPQSYADHAGKTSFPYLAIDDNQTSYTEISTDADAYPSIVYDSWETPSVGYSEVTLYIKRSSSGNKDDKWAIEYTEDGGSVWQTADLMTSDNLDVAVLVIALDQVNLAGLKVRINTDKFKGGDGGILRVYEIWTEGEYVPGQTQEPFLKQSNYGFFESIDPSDFFAINDGEVQGEARAIAVYDGIVYTAGSVIGGWRIEKRASADGNLEGYEENSNGGDPYEILISNDSVFIIGNGFWQGDHCWWVENRGPDLQLVSDFGDNGTLRINPSEYKDTAYAALVLDGKLYLLGNDLSLGENNSQWRLEVIDPYNGSRIQDPVLSNPSRDHDFPLALATDGIYLYSGGYDSVEGTGKNKKFISNARWRIEIRHKDSLDILTQVVTKNHSSNYDTVTALAVDDNFLYVAGVQEIGFWDTLWVGEKRPLFDPANPNSVLSTNYVIENDYGFEDRPESIVVQGGVVYFAGYSSDSGSGGDTGLRIEARSADTGDLIYYVFNDIDGEYNDRWYDISLNDSYMFVAGYETFSSLPHWLTVKRRLVDGSLGKPITDSNISSGDDFRCKILLHVGDEPLQIADQQFKLQYSEKPNFDDCADIATYADITSSTPIAFTVTPLGLDGSNAIPGNLSDPVHDGHTIRYQTLETANDFTNSISEINVNEDGLWDFSLKATTRGSYCLRIIRSDGTPLSQYIDYPVIEVVSSQ
jgi:hypothetical protein